MFWDGFFWKGIFWNVFFWDGIFWGGIFWKINSWKIIIWKAILLTEFCESACEKFVTDRKKHEILMNLFQKSRNFESELN